MSATNSFLRRTAWIAIFAVLMQLLLPALYPTMAAAMDMPAKVSIHHCSASDHNSDNTTGRASHAVCPICMAMHFMPVGDAPPPDIVLTNIAYTTSIVRQFADATVPVNRIATAAQPRAPPSLV